MTEGTDSPDWFVEVPVVQSLLRIWWVKVSSKNPQREIYKCKLQFTERPKFLANHSLFFSLLGPSPVCLRVTQYLVPSLNDLSTWTSLRALSALFNWIERGGKMNKPMSIILSKSAKPHALCREAPKEYLSLEGFILNKNGNSVAPYFREERGILKLVHWS